MNLDAVYDWAPMAATLLVALFLNLLPLPETLAMARPNFFAATVIFWLLAQPARMGIFSAWLLGLLLDASVATPLGQHGMALAIAGFAAVSMRGLLRDFPTPQQSLLLLPALAAYEFVLFWVDGVTGRQVDWLWRLLPVLSTAMMWPIWVWILEFTTAHAVKPQESD